MILRGNFATRWTPDNAFEHVRAIDGKVVKAKDNRRVVKFYFQGETFYLKHHRGVGWIETIKCLARVQLPVLGASDEWKAIEYLTTQGIATMTAIAFGQTGFSPVHRESFLITRELADTASLESICKTWDISPPSYAIKKALITRVASIARLMKEIGVNHRDFYLSHLLLSSPSTALHSHDCKPKLYLVDLHRMQIRTKVPMRWLVKDLASIYFSSLDIGLSKRDAIRFIREYSGTSAREALENKQFWQAVNRRTKKLYRKDHGREAVLLL
jgi:heptose I phosphotransferase